MCVKCAKVIFLSLLHFIPSYYPKTKQKNVSPLVLLLQPYDTSLLLFVLSASLSLSSLRGLDAVGGWRVSDPGLGG